MKFLAILGPFISEPPMWKLFSGKKF